MKQLFLLEDDMSLISGLSFAVKKQGYEIDVARTTLEADTLWENGKYDLAILDVSLPDGSGFDFCKKIRSTSKVPIMFLTAADEETDIIMGLDIGGDDYITKPFSVEELLARIRVTQRRLTITQTDEQNKTSIFENGELKIDFMAGCTYLKGEELHLTPIEYKLLCILSRNVGKVLTHMYITQQIWGRCSDNDIASLRVFMATLRKKLEPEKNGVEYIQTHIGIGYRMLRIENNNIG